MDTKITLSFNKEVIDRAKKYAEEHNMSLSRLMEFVLDRMTSKDYASLEELPIADWVNKVAEGEAVYVHKPKSSKALKSEHKNRKK